MQSQEIINKLDRMIELVKQENFIINFPEIVNSLEYIYYILAQERKEMTPQEQYLHGVDITGKVIQFFSELVKQYIHLKYNKSIVIKREDIYSLAVANGGYNSKSDEINYSIMGMMLGAINPTSYIHTFLHEARHKIQHDLCKEKQIIEILKYPPHMIILSKTKAYIESPRNNNQEFYLTNYNNIHLEVDAENFSLSTINGMILDLFLSYLEYSDNNQIEVNQQLKLKVEKLYETIKSHTKEIEKLSNESGKIDPTTVDETYGRTPIESTYNVNGQTEDILISTDKYIKSNPEIQEEMPIFKLIFNGNKPKTYEEIINERKILLQLFKEDEELSIKIEKLYHCIIISDPVLYLTDLVMHNEKEKIIQFIDKHPSIFLEYPVEIEQIIDMCTNEEIYNLLNDKAKFSKKK